MRKNFLFLTTLFILLLYSCSSNNTKQTGKETTENESFKTLDTIVPFSGYWVSETYYKCLMATRSTRTAQEILTGESACVVTIPKRTLQEIGLIWNFHEGGSLTLVKNRDTYQAWIYDDLVTDLTKKIFDINIISGNKIKVGDAYYIKLSEKLRVEDYIDEKLIGEILFKGIYTTDNDDVIEFKSDGKVTGLDDFFIYFPVLDYYAPSMDVDIINLGKTDKSTRGYGYKFDKDTLLIYDVKCTEYYSASGHGEEMDDCEKIGFGELKYKLWRK